MTGLLGEWKEKMLMVLGDDLGEHSNIYTHRTTVNDHWRPYQGATRMRRNTMGGSSWWYTLVEGDRPFTQREGDSDRGKSLNSLSHASTGGHR